jgi:predicted esterase
MKKFFLLLTVLILYLAALPCTAQENAVNPWLKDVPPGYVAGKGDESRFGLYLNLFDELVYKGDPTTGDITYYVYDPVKHGADPNKTYPVFYWFHGGGMSFTGKRALSITGAEQYAGPDYQKKLGGAYIIFPLANERTFSGWRRQVNGQPSSGDTPYANAFRGILDEFRKAHGRSAGKVAALGVSAGGFATWRFIINDTESVGAAIPMSSSYYPSVEELVKLEKAKIPILVIHGYHDELAEFETSLKPILPQIMMRSNIDVALLEWVIDHDHKTINSLVMNGVEQGQHSTSRPVSYNLIYDDGTPYSKAAPDGFIAWVLNALNK